MRMDASSPLTAAEIVNTWDERELADDLRELRRGAVLPPDRPRDRAPPRLAPDRAQRRPGRGDQVRHPDARPGSARAIPAKRVFQALRIATNDELQSLREGLDAALDLLHAGRPDRRHQLPLARGPDRQALHPRRRARLHLPAGLPGVRVRPPAGAAVADIARRRAERRGAVREPALGVGQAARRREDAGAVSVAVPGTRPGPPARAAGHAQGGQPRRGRAGAASPRAAWPGSACSPRSCSGSSRSTSPPSADRST